MERGRIVGGGGKGEEERKKKNRKRTKKEGRERQEGRQRRLKCEKKGKGVCENANAHSPSLSTLSPLTFSLTQSLTPIKKDG